MAFKNILVHLDESKACGFRVEAAASLAAAHDAHLTGLALAVEPNLPGFAYNQLQSAAIKAMREQVTARAGQLAESFEQALKGKDVKLETLAKACVQTEIAPLIGLHARYADLVVMGQADPDAPPPGGMHLPEEVALGAGRPVLVVPYVGARKTLGEHITVAWDAGREAARAISDALPALVAAKSVQVLVINPEVSRERHGADPGADIARYLARHDVKVEVQRLTTRELSVGDTILSVLADRGSDLLVMGAYGHSRLRELMLGGVTRQLMTHMTVPVLLSH